MMCQCGLVFYCAAALSWWLRGRLIHMRGLEKPVQIRQDQAQANTLGQQHGSSNETGVQYLRLSLHVEEAQTKADIIPPGLAQLV